jgi:glycosyltransferase involved in cell wall biosynthesis
VSGAGEPLVSVVLPVHDGERYLAAAIDSVLGQTHRNLELIVLDDGSTDGSAAIAASFDDPRIVPVRNERNLGLVPTLNRGLGLARGEFIARMDADDVAEPTRLARQLERFATDASIVALGTAIDYIDAEGRPTGVPRRQVQGEALLRWRLLRGTCVYHPTLMLHRARAGADARYSIDFPHAEDYELLLRLSRGHAVDNLPEVLLHQRVHAESVSARHRDAQRDSAARALVAHVRTTYGLEIAPGAARALLDPRHYFSPASAAADWPVAALLALEHCFIAKEAGLSDGDRKAVRRDVAFFLWKLAALAVTDWNGGPLVLRRLRTLIECAARLALRPFPALAALAWR